MSSGTGRGLQLGWLTLPRGGVYKELTQRSQFDSEQVGLAEALIRESGQNTLDASLSDRKEPVRMRIAIVQPTGEDARFLADLLQPLKLHLDSCEIRISDQDLEHPSLLVIEDFETTGLRGTWSDDDATSGWNDFFRQFGTSHKTGSRGGRWGLGKLVFTSASRIRTFFAVTVQVEDAQRQPLLMGQTILSAHKIGEQRYDSHGFFAAPHQDGELQLPVRDPEEIERFCHACNLERSNKTGLSIIIPFPVLRGAASAASQELSRHVLANFFFPILSNDLIVNVNKFEVSEENFDALIKNFGNENMNAGKLAGFVREMKLRLGLPPDLVLQSGWSNDIVAAFPPADLDSLRTRFRQGQLVNVRFPVELQHHRDGRRSSHVDVVIRRTSATEQAASICIRGMLTVPGEAGKFQREGCFVGLVASEEGVVSFLGDAEEPAHTYWNGREARLNTNWRAAPIRLAEVRKAPRELYKALASAAESTEDEALIDDFWVPDNQRSPSQSTQRKPASAPAERDPLMPSPRRFTIARRPGGFVVAPASGLQDEDLPLRIRIRVAYDLLRGDPFKKHSPLDFNLDSDDEIDVDVAYCRVLATSANVVVVEANSRDFKATFAGFDLNRDLVIDAQRLR
jgi:hypothetical protein